MRDVRLVLMFVTFTFFPLKKKLSVHTKNSTCYLIELYNNPCFGEINSNLRPAMPAGKELTGA